MKLMLGRLVSPVNFILAAVVLLTACSGDKTSVSAEDDLLSQPVIAENSIIKSPNDHREYRTLVLQNQLKVILISDTEADKAAVSMDINSGSNSDPDDFAGLAHFLEHMLFLGTEKYPEAGEYQEYIASHGGSHNAYTAYENTNYYFDIETGFLAPALARFSQFFYAPLFTPEYVDRERNAVHSEYQSNLLNDGRRAYAALKAIMNPAHPLARFSVGSLETLQDRPETTLREALLQHYEDNYSANLMSVAIFSNDSLDDLETLARQYFSPILNRQIEAPSTTEPIFLPGQLPAMLAIKPVRDSRSLSYTFPIPVLQQHYASKPLAYLGNIIGHEGEGSLLSLLKNKGWVNGLSAGSGMAYQDNASFSISLSLTATGVSKVDEITRLVFQFITLVKEQGIQEWVFNEQKTMAELSFLYQEPTPGISLTSTLSRRLQQFPAEHIMHLAYVYETFDADLITSILRDLRPENLLMTLRSQEVITDTIEPNFGAHYAYTNIDENRMKTWQTTDLDASLAIALPNQFLPEKLSLKSNTNNTNTNNTNAQGVNDKPKLLVDEDGIRLWFKQDDQYHLPRANFYLYAMTPLVTRSLENSLLASFAVSLVNDQLREYSYPANLAGVYYGVSNSTRGFRLRLGGYDDKQLHLLETLLQTIVAADFDPERFDIIKAEKIRAWQNASKQTPYLRLLQQIQALIINPYWSEQQRIEAVASITVEDVEAFVPTMLKGLKIEALYHGNVVEQDAQAMLSLVKKYLSTATDAQAPPFSTIVKIPQHTRVVQQINVEHEDSALAIYFQAPDDSVESRATVSLLAALLRTPFYDTLRTEQQLGYIVNATAMPVLKVNALVMYIESPTHHPLALESHIDVFLQGYSEQIAQMPQALFDNTKAGVLNNLRQTPQRQSELSSRYWNDILIEEYDQDSILLMADAIEKLSKQELVDYFQRNVNNPKASRLVARSVGNSHQDAFLNEQAATINAINEINVEQTDSAYQTFKSSAQQYHFKP